MSWTLVTAASFDRRARKFLTGHPDLRPRLAETLEKLRVDPFEPSLRLYPLTSKLQGLQAVSLQIAEHEILLLDIGSHDEAYG